jgi:hypothetical protein
MQRKGWNWRDTTYPPQPIGPRCPCCGAPVNPLCQPLRIFF